MVKYFTYYRYQNGADRGYGRCVHDLDEEITTEKHVEDMERRIKDDLGWEHVVLCNFIKLSDVNNPN